ncbi:FKBP-type peptidyl-prolyl cis-trans isomerase [uncultured Mediterranea sp.]|uniref:FKBP-type peptidyl-prolyl cis-trans isomerase n=1 Tax=uncultured Mediterranea sp. TaxID=1926662 RepID=UPI0027D97D1C|nr:FKBP-type peptidyl-prolyl cis-trans isomerase [uncultured Mediterranea sp.]
MKILNSQFKKLLLVLPLVTLFFVSCEEVQEASKYDNWQARNEAFIDSLSREPNVFVSKEEDADRMQVGELFRIKDDLASTTAQEVYIYCKKIVANTEGQRPIYTETVSTYYYGTLITGDKFDGTFNGYSAIDQEIPSPPDKVVTEFDWTADFAIDNSSLRTGWKAALQLMKTGERWMVYLPYQSAYGTSGSGSIPGYSTLAFDIVLDDIVTDED